jgi:thioredoxin-related protein
MNKKFLILAATLLLAVPTLLFADYHKCVEKDWTLAAHEAEDAKAPIIVLYSAEGCGYCEKLKAEVLLPLFGIDDENRLAVVREVDINAGGKMTDFNGERIRSRQFKQRYKVFATPTLLILDKDGNSLSQPIVGYDSKEQYLTRLGSLLEHSHMEIEKDSLMTEAVASAH